MKTYSGRNIEWADDNGRGPIEIEIRCVDEACRWCGYTKAIQEYGCWTWSINDCPDCCGAVEQSDWREVPPWVGPEGDR